MGTIFVDKKTKLYLFIILAFAALLRFYNLGKQSLWTDELLSYWAFVSTPEAPYWKKFFYDVHAPLYHLVLHFWSLISLKEFWLRAPGAVAGTVSVYLIYRWARHFLSEKRALITAALLAANPMHLYYSQELRFYSFLVMFSIVTLIQFERFLHKPRLKNTVTLAAAMVAMCLSHFSGLFIVVSLFIVAAMRLRTNPKTFKRYALAILILVVVISPWIYREASFLKKVEDVIGFSAPEEVRFREHLSFTTWAYPYSIFAFSTGYSYGPDLRELHLKPPLEIIRGHFVVILIFAIAFIPLFIIGLIKLSNYRRVALFAITFLVSIGGLTLMAMMNVKVFNVRYLLCLLPLYLATISIGLPDKHGAGLFFILLVFLVFIKSDLNYYFVSRYSRDDVKRAVGIIEEYGKPGDIVLILTVRDVFEFYYRGNLPHMAVYPRSSGPEKVRSRVKLIEEKYRRVWYLRCRYWDWDPENILLGTLEEGYTMERLWTLPGIDLYLFKIQ